jgi:dTDP-4-dehydrorhamnose 3,5-epimerase-like enzyme
MSEFVLKILPRNADARGVLTVLENDMPFPVARIFWISSPNGAMRGGHRHHRTRQGLVAIHGTVEVYMNDGKHDQTIILDNDGLMLVVEPEDWHTMKFQPGAILLVMASHKFDLDDYIGTKHS